MKNGNPIIKAANIDWSLVPQTRVHEWKRSLGPQGSAISLKREDEARFGMTAGKLRKFASIMPWLQAQSIDTVALIGSANSNQILAAAILLREHNMRPIPFLKKGNHQGTNQFLLSLLVDRSDWQVVESAQWTQVEEIAGEFVAASLASGKRAIYLPEGACIPQALAGAMTLAKDILRDQEALHGDEFEDIFIDAGTGLSAAALLMGMHDLGMGGRVHVTLMADSEEVFLSKFQTYCTWYASVFERHLPDLQDRFVFHLPAFAKSYGSVNAEVLQTIERYAKQGIFTDPIYSAKHLATVEQYLDALEKPIVSGLVIHSGGAQVLPGYMHLFSQ